MKLSEYIREERAHAIYAVCVRGSFSLLVVKRMCER